MSGNCRLEPQGCHTLHSPGLRVIRRNLSRSGCERVVAICTLALTARTITIPTSLQRWPLRRSRVRYAGRTHQGDQRV